MRWSPPFRWNGEPRRGRIVALALLLVAAGTAGTVPALRPAEDGPAGPVTPAVVTAELAPGQSLPVAKQVLTPPVPPMPEVVLLVDGTGSMGDAIQDVRGGLPQIVKRVRDSQPDARFAVATYGDQKGNPPNAGFSVTAPLTQDDNLIQAGVNKLDHTMGGGPGPTEDFINGLWNVSQGAEGKTVFRENSSPVIVLIGDASSHNPSNGHTLEDTISALQEKNIRVVGVDVDTKIGDGLDGTGDAGDPNYQDHTTPNNATRIIEATGGTKLSGIVPDQVAEAVVRGLTNLPTSVGHQLTACDPGLTVALDPPVRDVVSGQVAGFDETITVHPDAPQGRTLTCTVEFLLGTRPPNSPNLGPAAAADPAYTESISITVKDVTAPVVTLDDRTARAISASGTHIDYTATAVDAVDGPLTPQCTPASGSLFPVGETTVTCTATDKAGNTGTDTAVFRVLPPPVPPSADLAVTLRLAPARAYTGRAAVATYTLTNAGPDTARGVVLDSTWPDSPGRQLGAVSDCTAVAPCQIPPGGRLTVTQTAVYGAALTGSVQGSVRGILLDPRRGNNTATARLQVLQPRLDVTPSVLRPGETVVVRGADYPPGATVRLVWSVGLTADTSPVRVGPDGTFEAQVLVLRRDRLGPRELWAEVPRLPRLKAPVLVVQHALQPPDFAERG
ncbi:VWA domain-containing protein [Streptomyces sp. NPDC004788]